MRYLNRKEVITMRRALMSKAEAAENLKVFNELVEAYIKCMDEDLKTAGSKENTEIAERAEAMMQAFDISILKDVIADIPYYVVRERIKPITVNILLDMCDMLKGRSIGEKVGN